MELSDEEFEALLQALRANPDSPTLAEAAAAAADTVLRRALLKALRLPRGTDEAAAGAPPEAGDDSPGGGTVIEMARHRPVPSLAESAPLRLEEVGGLEPVKQQLRRRLLDPISHPGLFRKFRRRSGGGLLLYGPPGCGKTMVVKAVAAEAGVRLVKVEAAEVLDGVVGLSEKKLTAAFAEARRSRPCVLFFDEVEALAGRRSMGTDFKAGLVSAFLTAFDGLASENDGVLVIAATNTPWAVDTAFRRPGRFDRTLFVPPPDRGARESILRTLLRQRPTADDVATEALAAATSGFSGADLVNLVETAIDVAIEQCIQAGAEERIAMRHLLAAVDEVRPTTLEWLATARNYAKYANEGGAYQEVLDFLARHAA